MTISRSPHPVFAAIWFARYLGMFGSIAMGSIIGLAVFSALFIPVEGYGLFKDTGRRDMLSELWTWAVRTLSKPQGPDWRWWHPWNLLAPMFAALEAGVVYALATYHGMLPAPVVAVICMALFVLLTLHWLRPEVYG